MKRILITGANSYIGTSFENYMTQFDGYEIDTVDMIGEGWRNKDFSRYDVVFHVAGIAHQRETKKNASLYYKINRDLAVETAANAKAEGVKHFVFLSSMSVFGMTTGIINDKTVPHPKSNYGKSKLEAETEICMLKNENFLVTILRPPMVYGEGCKGNYQLLKKAALILPLFPDIVNKRSMIFINRLCEYVKKVIDEKRDGYFFPQDKEYICTTDMVRKISKDNGRSIKITKLFNPIIYRLNFNVINKIFGDLIYQKD